MVTMEVCSDSVEGARAAQQGGAQQVELCDNLLEGGTTPSAGAIAVARQRLDIEINVMIRPRGGDFCYSDLEFEVMKYDIEQAKQLGANGVVIGLLKADGSVDRERIEALVKLAHPLRVTFHRAFDMSRDPQTALETLINLGVDRVLTSGQEASALEGLELITGLVQQAAGRIIVMPGGGINERNIGKIIAQSRATDIHITGRHTVESAMSYRNERCFMGGTLRPPEFSRLVTDSGRVQEMVSRLS
jgi:copper homeostasis protein